MRRHAVDTGPLVAFLDRRDAHHLWARSTLDEVAPPLVTCEAVVAEAMHLLRHHSRACAALMALFSRQLVAIEFRFERHRTEVEGLIRRYSDVPMSFADACLVRMAEVDSELAVITLDRDFLVYRRHGRAALPLVTPH